MGLGGLPPQTIAAMRKLAPDIVAFEQLTDVLRHRSFRQTLLVHDNVTIDRRLGAHSIAPLAIASPVAVAPRSPSSLPDAPVVFVARNGKRFGIANALTRAALLHLIDRWPESVRFAELYETARRALPPVPGLAGMRGDSGPEALGGMAPAEQRERGWLLRPLLGVGRDVIDAYARARGLAWVDDPMNADEAFLRATLRASVLPALAAGVPGLRDNVLRSAALLRDAGDALRAVAEADLAAAGLAVDRGSIDRCSLAALPAFRRNEAVREWFRLLGVPMPTQPRLAQWVAQMLLGGSASAAVVVAPIRFRRYRDRVSAEPMGVRDWRRDPPPPLALRWRGESAIELPGWAGRLCVRPASGPGALDAAWLAGQPLEVRPPPAGARLRPRNGGPSRTLKNLYQERGVPPWLRAAMPAVFTGNRLLYVAGIGMDASGAPAEGGEAVRLHWRPDDPDDPRSAGFEPVPAV